MEYFDLLLFLALPGLVFSQNCLTNDTKANVGLDVNKTTTINTSVVLISELFNWGDEETCITTCCNSYESGMPHKRKSVWNFRPPNIRITGPCDLYPLAPHFYIVKLGFAGVYIIFLFLLQNIDCGCALEPHLCFEKKLEKNITIFHLKIIVFTAVKYYSIIHRRVFVMDSDRRAQLQRLSRALRFQVWKLYLTAKEI